MKMIDKIKELNLQRKFKGVTLEYYEEFCGDIIYCLNVENIKKEYINKAKSYDGEFLYNCFRYSVIYNIEKQKYTTGILEYITEYDGSITMEYLTDIEIQILDKIIDKELKEKENK